MRSAQVRLGRGEGSTRTPAARMAGICLLLTLSACEPSPFSYQAHQPPRVSVTHSPIHPGPGAPIRVTARAEPRAGTAVAAIEVLAVLSGRGLIERTCTAAAECVLEIPTGGDTGPGIYMASTRDSGGGRATAGPAYLFQVGDPGATTFPLRVPVDFYRGDPTIKVLLVRDRETYDRDSDLWRDAEALLYEGVLADPAYRWRDRQLGFFYTTVPGVTRDYHSGVRSRCGQEPWLGVPGGAAAEASAEAQAAFADVIAVIHRRGGRDCAGLGVIATLAGARGRFSADGLRPSVFHHELGHALAALSDEYAESTETRRTGANDVLHDPTRCRCCTPAVDGECRAGQPVCGVDPIPPGCYPAETVCPPLGSECAYPNVFPSRLACEAASIAIASHPGVEFEPAASDCRLLCSGPSCPCLPFGDVRELWILDRRTPPRTGATDDDLMGSSDSFTPREMVGPACGRCLEAVFCLRWELGRGRTQGEADSHCLL